MPVDPTEPETFEEAMDDESYPTPAGVPDPETPEADAAEQRTEVVDFQDRPLSGEELDAVNPADAAEQARVVELDEDDYR